MDQNTQESKQIGKPSKVKQKKANSIQRVNSAEITPVELLHRAVELNADIDKLEKLMELQIRYEDRQARKSYVKALARFRSKCPPIVKTKRVTFESKGSKVGYSYAPLDKALEVIKPIEEECGLDHTWLTESTEKGIKVICKLTHIDGHSETNHLMAGPDTSGSKNSIQAIGSTIFYLERYTLLALLGIAPQDMDDDGNGADKPTEPTSQKKLIELLIADAWRDYSKKNSNLLSADSEISLEKFTEELRVQFGKLTLEQKNRFEWHRDKINELVEKININNVIIRKGKDVEEAQGQ